eukprot:GHRQ01008100.1.p1 GENE.GHRQ01008100.1~~GHRQ01008100.1.p1  ORF type:complete len:130 (-),score=6.33 GHRQ01008100.1:578-928(-)
MQATHTAPIYVLSTAQSFNTMQRASAHGSRHGEHSRRPLAGDSTPAMQCSPTTAAQQTRVHIQTWADPPKWLGQLWWITDTTVHPVHPPVYIVTHSFTWVSCAQVRNPYASSQQPV